MKSKINFEYRECPSGACRLSTGIRVFQALTALSEVFGRDGDRAHIIGSIGSVYLNWKITRAHLSISVRHLPMEMIGSKSGIEIYISNIDMCIY